MFYRLIDLYKVIRSLKSLKIIEYCGIIGENIFLLARAIVQLCGCVLELLVFDQLPDQFPARVVLFRFIGWRLLIEREQTAAFNVKEVRSHDDEFAGHVDVQFFERIEIFEVLPGNVLDRDVVNADLVALDQIQQQIERALENFELDLVVCSHW